MLPIPNKCALYYCCSLLCRLLLSLSLCVICPRLSTYPSLFFFLPPSSLRYLRSLCHPLSLMLAFCAINSFLLIFVQPLFLPMYPSASYSSAGSVCAQSGPMLPDPLRLLWCTGSSCLSTSIVPLANPLTPTFSRLSHSPHCSPFHLVYPLLMVSLRQRGNHLLAAAPLIPQSPVLLLYRWRFRRPPLSGSHLIRLVDCICPELRCCLKAPSPRCPTDALATPRFLLLGRLPPAALLP